MSRAAQQCPEARLVGGLAVGLAVISVVIVVLDLLRANLADAGLGVLFVAASGAVFILNRFGREQAALTLLLVAGNLWLFFSALATPLEEHGSLGLSAGGMTAVALLPAAARKRMWALALLPVGLALLTEFGRPLFSGVLPAAVPADPAMMALNAVGTWGVMLSVLTFRVRVHLSAQRALQALLAELRRQEALVVSASRNSALGEVAAGIAHEVNNPLSVVLLAADRGQQLLRLSPPDEAGARVQLRRVITTARRISRIVQSLMRVSNQERRPGLEPVALDPLISDTLDLCQERIQRAGVRLDLHVSPGLFVLGRETDLAQVLLNLLLNSFDAVKGAPVRWVRLQAKEEEGRVVLEVTDSGPGISDGVRQRLMEPFFTTRKEGTGLGLALSRGLMEGMGGSLVHAPDAPHTCFRAALRSAAGPALRAVG